MPKQTLKLSTYQQDLIEQLDIDAWYLSPLSSRDESDDAQAKAIAQQLAKLSESLQMPTPPVASSSNLTSTTTKATSPPADVDSGGIEKNSKANPSRGKRSAASAMPAPIELSDSINLSLPIDSTVSLSPDRRIHADLDSIDRGIDDLHQQYALPVVRGMGSDSPEIVVIVPPPTLAQAEQGVFFEENSRIFLNEMLTSIGLSLLTVYVTPLLKQVAKVPLDPSTEQLSEQLPILWAELAFLSPKRIIVMGRQPCQTLLQTSAPLSEIMTLPWSLAYTHNDEQYVIPMTCLPSPDYFVRMPSQKGWLWQRLKQL